MNDLKTGRAVHMAKYLKVANGKIIRGTEHRSVRVMAIAENYAMVRRKGCMPYVCHVDELANVGRDRQEK